MENLWNWLLRNFSNFLSFLSILITIYFGLFYVPSYLQDVQKEKIQNSKAIIEQTIKELIYSDSVCRYKDIEPLIRSQEIVLNQSFPLSVDDLLTEVQNSFFQDKFLPLIKRSELNQKITLLRASLPKTTAVNEPKNNTSSSVLTSISAIITIILTILGVYSSFKNFKEAKQVEEEINSTNFDIDHVFPKSYSAIEYEESILSALNNYSGILIKKAPNSRQDNGFDFEFTYNNKQFFVEVKYLQRSKLGTNSLRRFLAKLQGLEGEFWLIHNQGLTSIVQRKFNELNNLITDHRQIRFIKAQNALDLESQLPDLLKS